MVQEYRVKDLSSLDFKNGHKEQYELEGLEKGKVLLVKVNDQVHAMSANCTHYGAPLKNGVVNSAGRITCPWHGACFNIATGDVEDAPALDPLSKYEVFEKDGAVYIRGDEAVIKQNKRKLNLKCAAKGPEKVVIVGGGSGGLGAMEALRGGGFTGDITVITSEGYRPIDRTKLSKALLTDIEKLAWRPEEFYKEADIDLVEDKVTSIDFAAKKLQTESGETFDYTKLILATGGSPRWLPLDGLKGDLENVFVLRTLPHAKSIMGAIGENGKKVVVVGSSFIGMEVANCLQGKGNDVSVIGMESEPMERVMGTKIGRIFRGLLEKTGVKFYLNASVSHASPSSNDSSKVGAVHLKDGTVLEADVVIEGVGISPQTSYLQGNSKVDLLKDQSLLTNEAYEVKGLKDVYAIGDIATYPYHGPGGKGNPIRIEHWNVAQNSGRSVAHVINNPGSKPKPFIPVFWSALGQQLRYCGNTVGGYDDVVIQGDTEKPAFAAYYTQGDEVVAVATMGKDPVMVQSAELMRRGKMPTKRELLAGADVLQIELPAEIVI
ncbi:hypothetical protein EJ06DRAFT_548200 [Trichodelitschia bisporula]|uniref:Rieske domain-containing protein n=1 Tax=Trichodelitschia bisporula TaxID=703511 RepID=A0A6G1I1N0_9PEZI|nr:hypothetical protein EJ06DRAFT_548200 [Trichodelitschia bisporula]